VINFDFMIEEGVISPADLRHFVFRETAQDIWATIVQWHESHAPQR
jgi:predicted Rossmann-fold nucleotide-binding protein